MRKRYALALTALLVAAAWLSYGWLRSSDAVDSSGASAGEERTGKGFPPMGWQPGPGWAADPESGSIAGRVTVRGAGTAPPDAQVCAKVYSEQLPSEATREPICIRTTPAGTYRLTDLVAGDYDLTAGARGYVPWSRQGGSLRLRAGEERTSVDFELDPGGAEVRGTVADISGGPIADAWVRGGGGFARSDEGGAFVLWTREDIVWLDASAVGYAGGEAMLQAPARGVEVFLTPESTLVGRVTEAGSGRPVPGARVQAGGEYRPMQRSDGWTFSDAHGNYRIAGLWPGRYKPTATTRGARGEALGSVRLGLGETRSDVVIELWKAATVRGEVVVDDGKSRVPCPRGRVGLRSQTDDNWAWQQTDDQGQVEFVAVTAGSYAVKVACEGSVDGATHPDVVVGEQDVGGLVWSVRPGVSLSGVVRTRSGDAVVDATVRADARRGNSFSDGRGRARTSGDGRFEMKGLSVGTYLVEVNARGHRKLEEPIEVSLGPEGVSGIEVILEEGGAIAGRVVDEDGVAVGGARVKVEPPSWANKAMTREDGTFRLAGLRPGPVRVMAEQPRSFFSADTLRRPGSTDDEQQGVDVEVIVGETQQVELVVEARSGNIRGRIVDTLGAPITDAFVDRERQSDASSARPGEAERAMRTPWPREAIATDTEGRFVLPGLSKGLYTVRAFRRGGGEVVAEDVAIGSDIVMSLADTSAVNGTVVLAGGTVPDPFIVSADDPERGYSRTETFRHSKGQWTLQDLPPGDYHLTASATQGAATYALTLAEGEHAEGVTLTLQPLATVTGTVVAADTKRPLEGFHITARRLGAGPPGRAGSGGEVRSDASGAFKVEGVHAGLTEVWAWPARAGQDEYTAVSTVVSVESGATVDVGALQSLKSRITSDAPRGMFGFRFADRAPEDRPEERLIEVSFIFPGTPASESGLQVGDIITTIDGVDVTGLNAQRYRPLVQVSEGTTVRLGLKRGVTIEMTAGPMR